MQLQIHHAGWRDGLPFFEVVRSTDMKRTKAIPLPSPAAFPVIDHPTKMLLPDLRWYLEDYLQVPYGAYHEEAESTAKTVGAWGQEVFDTLFNGYARDWYQEAKQENFADFQIKITTDSPEIMSWPWEALRSEDDGYLALRCCVERQLCTVADPLRLPENLPQDAIHILYIIARPGGEQDVSYHALAGSLVDYSSNSGLPITIDVLRPPTFDQLQKVLRDRPGYYHIIHFDGHGGYGEPSSTLSNDRFSAPEGLLVFETDEGGPESIETVRLSQLLAEYNIPVMVMNACQSGMIDGQAQAPFASVAAGLLKAGIRSVVAMGYSLYVSGAREFVPAFYECLFSDSRVSEAVRVGRNQMFRQPARACVTGKQRLDDWLVPVLYQNLPAGKKILPKITPDQTAHRENCYLPEEALQIGDYGFIGRESFILKLERAIQQRQAGILIHGQTGIGKTTLAKGFLQWLQNTGGLHAPVNWFDFQAIHSAEYVINTLVSTFIEFDVTAKSMKEKLERLADVMRTNPCLVVWDNFESASGIEGTEVSPQLSEEDRGILASLLQELYGGKTKILITSRAKENWLSKHVCRRVQLEGLDGEELWEYCNAVVQDLGLKLDRNNETYRKILEKLCGNPLVVRAVLLRLDECGAGQLLRELEASFEEAEGDEGTRRIQAAYAVFGRGLLERYLPVLRVTGLFEQYVDIDIIKTILANAQVSVEKDTVTICFHTLENAGFCTHIGDNIFRLHPTLRGYLEKQNPATEVMQKCFVNAMGYFAENLTKSPLHKTRYYYELNLANFYHARRMAETLGIDDCALAITQSLAYFALARRNFTESSILYQALATKAELCGNLKGMAIAYHQLGNILLEHQDFIAAENWYRKSLAIEEKIEDDYGIAITYHQLGMLAKAQRDFTAAKTWYQKALAIWQKSRNEKRTASIYHQLGEVAQEQRDFTVAETWYYNALEIEEKYRDEHAASITYYQLGVIAQEQRNFAIAEAWYLKTLEIEERCKDEYGAAGTYHQLGRIAEEQYKFTAAEIWYQKSLVIREKLGDRCGAAGTYYHLGRSAQAQRDFTAAEAWYHKALEINEKFDDKYIATLIYHQLGILAQEQRNHTVAEAWYHKALAIEERCRDEYGAAGTYHQLGMLAAEQRNYPHAAFFYLNAMAIFIRRNDPHSLRIAIRNYAQLLHSAPALESKKMRELWPAFMPQELMELLHQMEAESNDNGE